MIQIALQRKLINHDRAKWRTLTRVSELTAPVAMGLAAQLAKLGEPMELRIVKDDKEQSPIMHWTIKNGWH